MIVLSASNMKKAFGEFVLFDNASFSVEHNDKIGFVGCNGAGKTTFFKMLIGDASIDGGEIYTSKQTKIGYMEQHTCSNSEHTVWEELMTVFSELIDIEGSLEQIAHDIEQHNGNMDILVKKQHTLQESFERMDGFTYKSRARAALMGVGFSEDELTHKISTLSGGQKTRVSLCKILLSSANLLLLDEPTNHLDIQSVEWLEDYLRSYQGAVIVISHDRYFLDKITNKTMEMENGKLSVYPGSYTKFLKLKEENELTKQRQYDNTMKEISRLEGIIEQQKRWNREKNIKTAESKQKVIDRLEKNLEVPESQLENIHFEFTTTITGGNDVLDIKDLSMSFGENHLFSNVDMFLKRKDRAFLLGPNGCGKTTLFKIIMGELMPKGGSVKIGTNVQTGYYDQIQAGLSGDKTVFDEIHDEYPAMTQTDVRNALAAFLFKGEDVFKEISALSGGERARVLLLKLMLSKANFLLLDEPTNHLDIASREALEDALSGYSGTLLVVSHDRYFINKMADRIFNLSVNGMEKYDGNYDYFLEKQKPDVYEMVKEAPKKNDYQQKKEQAARQRKIENQIARTEKSISDTEEKITKLNEELSQQTTDYEKIMSITNELDELNAALNALYEQWDELHNELEECCS